MLSRSNFKISKLPQQWFFFNPLDYKDYDFFFKLKTKVGIVFFNSKIDKNQMFLEQIKPFVSWCKFKKIIFFIQCSTYWANKYKPYGIFKDEVSCKISDRLNRQTVNNKFLLATKIHNFWEAKKFLNNYDIFFVSNVFLTKTHPEKKFLNFFYFLKICSFLRRKVVFALGGVTEEKYNRLKFKNLHGFGGISYFIIKEQK